MFLASIFPFFQTLDPCIIAVYNCRGERGVEDVLKLNRILVIAVKQFNSANPPAHIATALIADSVPSGGVGKSPRIPTP